MYTHEVLAHVSAPASNIADRGYTKLADAVLRFQSGAGSSTWRVGEGPVSEDEPRRTYTSNPSNDLDDLELHLSQQSLEESEGTAAHQTLTAFRGEKMAEDTLGSRDSDQATREHIKASRDALDLGIARKPSGEVLCRKLGKAKNPPYRNPFRCQSTTAIETAATSYHPRPKTAPGVFDKRVESFLDGTRLQHRKRAFSDFATSSTSFVPESLPKRNDTIHQQTDESSTQILSSSEFAKLRQTKGEQNNIKAY